MLNNRHSGAWLVDVIPSPNIRTFLNNETVRIYINIRFGSRFCHPDYCNCGIIVDNIGSHGLCCKKSAGRIFRHSELNSILKQTFSSIDIVCL